MNLALLQGLGAGMQTAGRELPSALDRIRAMEEEDAKKKLKAEADALTLNAWKQGFSPDAVATVENPIAKNDSTPESRAAIRQQISGQMDAAYPDIFGGATRSTAQQVPGGAMSQIAAPVGGDVPPPAPPAQVDTPPSAETARDWEKDPAVFKKMQIDFLDKVKMIESGGKDIGAHPKAANGLQAHGMYGVVPEIHWQRATKPGDKRTKEQVIADIKKSEGLQRWIAGDIFRENLMRYKDPMKAVGAYYGGNYGAKVIGTPDGDKKQKLANGNEVDSVNDYGRKFFGDSFSQNASSGESGSSSYRGSMGKHEPIQVPKEFEAIKQIADELVPKRPNISKKINVEKSIRYILENAKDPAAFTLAVDKLGALQKLADAEDASNKAAEANYRSGLKEVANLTGDVAKAKLDVDQANMTDKRIRDQYEVSASERRRDKDEARRSKRESDDRTKTISALKQQIATASAQKQKLETWLKERAKMKNKQRDEFDAGFKDLLTTEIKGSGPFKSEDKVVKSKSVEEMRKKLNKVIQNASTELKKYGGVDIGEETFSIPEPSISDYIID